MNEFKADRYRYGVDPVYGRTSFLPVDRDKEYFASEGLYVREDSYKALEAALSAATDATTCPGHGRSECVSCCWPKGEGYTAVDMGTAAADGYRDGAARLQELLKDAYECGYGDGQNNPNGYSCDKTRDATLQELCK